MKKTAILTMLLACAILIGGCGSKDEPQESEKVEGKTTNIANQNWTSKQNTSGKPVESHTSSVPENKPNPSDDYNGRLSEIEYISGKTNNFAWILDDDGTFKSVKNDGTVIGEFKSGFPIAKTTSSGYTMFRKNDFGEYIVVDKTGKIVFSESSLGVTGFLLPSKHDDEILDYDPIWYDYEIPSMEDDYLMVYRISESFSGVNYEVGIVNMQGQWVDPLSSDHPVAKRGYDLSPSYFNGRRGVAYVGCDSYLFMMDEVFTLGLYNVQTKSIASLDSFGNDMKLYPEEYSKFVDGKMYISSNNNAVNYLYPDGTFKTFTKEELNQKDKTYQPIILENELGSRYFTLENIDGYKFEPVKLPDGVLYLSDDDGKFFVFESGVLYNYKCYVYDDTGAMFWTFDFANGGITISNGVLRIVYNKRVQYLKPGDQLDNYYT